MGGRIYLNSEKRAWLLCIEGCSEREGNVNGEARDDNIQVNRILSSTYTVASGNCDLVPLNIKHEHFGL